VRTNNNNNNNNNHQDHNKSKTKLSKKYDMMDMNLNVEHKQINKPQGQGLSKTKIIKQKNIL